MTNAHDYQLPGNYLGIMGIPVIDPYGQQRNVQIS